MTTIILTLLLLFPVVGFANTDVAEAPVSTPSVATAQQNGNFSPELLPAQKTPAQAPPAHSGLLKRKPFPTFPSRRLVCSLLPLLPWTLRHIAFSIEPI